MNLRGNYDITDFSPISKIPSLKTLNLSTNTNLHGNMFDFSKLTNLTILDLGGCKLWSEDLEYLKGLKNNTNLTINLSGNVNLTKESKEKIENKFKKNVSF